jgi:hypothetical protein
MTTELTNAERTLLKKVKDLKKQLKSAKHERDVLKGLLLAAGASEENLDFVLKQEGRYR